MLTSIMDPLDIHHWMSMSPSDRIAPSNAIHSDAIMANHPIFSLHRLTTAAPAIMMPLEIFSILLLPLQRNLRIPHQCLWPSSCRECRNLQSSRFCVILSSSRLLFYACSSSSIIRVIISSIPNHSESSFLQHQKRKLCSLFSSSSSCFHCFFIVRASFYHVSACAHAWGCE